VAGRRRSRIGHSSGGMTSGKFTLRRVQLDVMDHRLAGSTSRHLYPKLRTVAICTPASANFFGIKAMCTSSVQSKRSFSLPNAAAILCSRVTTRPSRETRKSRMRNPVSVKRLHCLGTLRRAASKSIVRKASCRTSGCSSGSPLVRRSSPRARAAARGGCRAWKLNHQLPVWQNCVSLSGAIARVRI
jgi:hypothetical protein